MKTPECVDCPAKDLPITCVSCSSCTHLIEFKLRKEFKIARPASSDSQISTIKGNKVSLPVPKTKVAKIANKRKMTKAESEYMAKLQSEFPKDRVIFEGISLKMQNNHRYTPDFMVISGTGRVLLVEVKQRGKNGFRQASYGRAKLAFDQAMIEFDCFKWRWAEKYKGEWM